MDYTDKGLFNWISVIYLEQNGYVNDMNKVRLYHEIYLSDPRKVAPENVKRLLDIL